MQDEQIDTNNYGTFAIIEREVLLKLGEPYAIMHGLISGLSTKKRICFAKPDYLANWLGISTDAARFRIKKLINHGYVVNVGSKKSPKLVVTSPDLEVNLRVTESDVTHQKEPFDPKSDVAHRKSDVAHQKKLYSLTIYIYKENIKGSNVFSETSSSFDLLNILFEYFWSQYPKKVKKKETHDMFFKLPYSKLELLIKIMPNVKSYYQNQDKSTFVPACPHPTTFINGERWEDDTYQTPQKKSQEGGDKKNGHALPPSPLMSLVEKIGDIFNGDNRDILGEGDIAMLDRVGLSIEEAVEVIEYEQRKGLISLITSRLETVKEAS